MEKLINKNDYILIKKINKKEKKLIYRRFFILFFLLRLIIKKIYNYCLLFYTFIFFLSYLLYYLSLEK